MRWQTLSLVDNARRTSMRPWIYSWDLLHHAQSRAYYSLSPPVIWHAIRHNQVAASSATFSPHWLLHLLLFPLRQSLDVVARIVEWDSEEGAPAFTYHFSLDVSPQLLIDSKASLGTGWWPNRHIPLRYVKKRTCSTTCSLAILWRTVLFSSLTPVLPADHSFLILLASTSEAWPSMK